MVCEKLERQLIKKTNKRFGWTDVCSVNIRGTDCWANTLYVAVFSGKAVKAKYDYYHITLEGNRQACQTMEAAINRWLDRIDRENILRDVRNRLSHHNRLALDAWQEVEFQKEPVQAH